jgi:hypothetical protein
MDVDIDIVELAARVSEEIGHRCAAVVGDDTFTCEVVGEARYQANIESIVGGRSGNSAQFYTIALLEPEPPNSENANPVCVKIGGRPVGHVPKRRSLAVKSALAGHRSTFAVARALIVGGWDRGPGKRGHFGVRLDAVTPFTLVSAADSKESLHSAPPAHSVALRASLPRVYALPPRRASVSAPWLATIGIVCAMIVAGVLSDRPGHTGRFVPEASRTVAPHSTGPASPAVAPSPQIVWPQTPPLEGLPAAPSRPIKSKPSVSAQVSPRPVGHVPIRQAYFGAGCDCPYDLMKNGRLCGGRSAWSKPGGRSPTCFADDSADD